MLKEVCACGRQRGVFPKSGYFTAIGLSSLEKIADRHLYVSYHNKHCCQAFQ